MIQPITLIACNEAPLKLFGFWPNFHDAETLVTEERMRIEVESVFGATCSFLLRRRGDTLNCVIAGAASAKFGEEVVAFLKASGLKPLRTSVRTPWQNGIAERWVGSVRLTRTPGLPITTRSGDMAREVRQRIQLQMEAAMEASGFSAASFGIITVLSSIVLTAGSATTSSVYALGCTVITAL